MDSPTSGFEADPVGRLAVEPLSRADLPHFEMDLVRGFLPPTDPLVRLPRGFEPWDEIAAAIPRLIDQRGLRKAIDQLPQLDPAPLGGAERERAMLILSILGNGYVWEPPAAALRIPSQLAVPWSRVAETLGRPAIAAHAAMVLVNWRRLDGPSFAPENLATLVSFRDLEDEAWFFLVTVAIEETGARAIPAMIDAQHAVAAGDGRAAAAGLETVAATIAAVTAMLLRMYERCRPEVFYHEVRPWVTGWPAPGVTYQGVSDTPRQLIGGSAAQSALIQAFDAGLGVAHPSPASGPFLAEMRRYMRPAHRRFLERLEQGPSIAGFAREASRSEPRVRETYRDCVAELSEFRKRHLEMAARYITGPAKGDPTARGTGGTEFGAFLGAAQRETLAARDRTDE
jgi:indoleamine 2,3-dioxygenase